MLVTSSTVLSSDALKGLGFVPEYQALEVWDDLEKNIEMKVRGQVIL